MAAIGEKPMAVDTADARIAKVLLSELADGDLVAVDLRRFGVARGQRDQGIGTATHLTDERTCRASRLARLLLVERLWDIGRGTQVPQLSYGGRQLGLAGPSEVLASTLAASKSAKDGPRQRAEHDEGAP
jgi:hypothetical protein